MSSNESESFAPPADAIKSPPYSDVKSPPHDSVKSPPFLECSATANDSPEMMNNEEVFVMDVTKKETCTTTLSVSRDRAGKLRYCMSKHSDCEMDGLANSSPTVRDRVRQDSLMHDFLPEVGQSKRDQVEPKQDEEDDQKQQRPDKRPRHRKRKKKQMEKVHEESEYKTHEVLITRSGQTSSTSSEPFLASQNKATATVQDPQPASANGNVLS